MIKKTNLLLVILGSFFLFEASAQSNPGSNPVDSFYVITRNKAWKVTKFWLPSDTLDADKKALLSNVTFRFNQDDSTKFLVSMPGKSDTIGVWFKQYNNTIRFSIPLHPDNDSLYYEGVKLLGTWPWQKIEMQPSLIKFKMIDPFKGEASIELSIKE